MDPAPISPAGIPVPNSVTEEAPSLSAMSLQDTGTDPMGPAPREGEAVVPLTERSLAVLGSDDSRRNMPGARSEWDCVTTPSPQRALLTGSPTVLAPSVHYSPHEISQVANFYHNQVLAPTLNQQVLVQNDTGPAIAAEAEARHSAIMNEKNQQFREQMARIQSEAISGAARLRLEFVQAENRLQHQEDSIRAAGESMANQHSEEISLMRHEASEAKAKLYQAESTVQNVVQHAELELAARSQAQSAAEAMSGQIHHLKAEMSEFMKIHQHQTSNMTRLERDNAELRSRLADAAAGVYSIQSVPVNASQYTGQASPSMFGISTPPGMGDNPIVGGGGGPPDDGPDDDGNDDDDDKKKSKKDKKKKKKKRDSSSSSSSSSSIGLSKKELLKMLKKVSKSKREKNDGTDDDEKRGRIRTPKEAEKIVFPKFPQPETYRNWRLRVREAVVAASDRPDEAFEWLSEVWKEGTTEEMLRDSSGFATLDAKIHSAITNVLEGDFARQMDTFKEREGHEGRYVRGRQILWRLDGYLATNALHGSVYDMEDLLNVVMVNDNLVQFIRNWDTVLSGIKKTPSDDVLESLFHRQVKKNKALAHDVAIYERAIDGSPEKTFEFLYKAANRHINAKRLEKNRDRMAKQAAAGMPSAPAPLKRVPKGFCIDFVRKGSCSKDNCPYKHEKPEKSRGRTPSGGKGKGRGRSPSGRGSPSPGRAQVECKFFKQGRCNKGDACRFLHHKPSAPAPGSGRESSGEKRKKKEKKDKRRKKSRSSSKSSKGSRGSKGSKGSGSSKGSGKGRRSPKPSIPAAVCLLSALVAGSASQADAHAFRKDMPIHDDMYSSSAFPALASVKFSNTPELYYIPTPEHESNWRPIIQEARDFRKEYPVNYKPKKDDQDLRDAQASAKMLRSTIEGMERGANPACRFKCKTEFGCNECIAANLTVGCPAQHAKSAPTIDMEWIADTGSAQDLVSRSEIQDISDFESSKPVNMMTANGPNYADRQSRIYIPSIGSTTEPYVLSDSPSVLSVGQKCMDEGFDFVWRANCRPYFRDPEGNKVYMDVRHNVPYLKSWKENVALPVRPVQTKSEPTPAEKLGRESVDSEQLANDLLKDRDFSHKSCLKLLRSLKYKPSKSNRLSVSNKSKTNDDVEYIVLGTFAHGGVQGITNITHKNQKACQYINAYLGSHGMSGDCSSLCINHGSTIKIHKDAHNMKGSMNHTISLGDFQGGNLWIHDAAARKGEPNVTSHRLGNKILYGKEHSTHKKLIQFDPKQYHCVVPWKGDRWSITAYVNRAVPKLPEAEIKLLHGYGFKLSKRTAIPAPVPDPEDDRVLQELLGDEAAPRPEEPRTKPKVKIRESEKKKKREKKSKSDAPHVLSDAAKEFDAFIERVETERAAEDDVEEVRRMIAEYGTEDEAEEPPKPDPARPPTGESSVPDGEGSSDPKVAKGIEALKKEAKSLHHLMTHIPKNPYCSVCNQAKMYKAPGYRTDGLRSISASCFGDHITADHVVLYRDSDNMIEDSRLALIVKDVATSFMYAYPSALKDADECQVALQHFVASTDKVGVFYSDNAKELTRATKSLGWRHEHSKDYIHQSNAIAERAVRATTEGTRCNLLQAGLSHVYWPQALEHSCTAFNISHPNGIEYSPWYKRFGEGLKGKMLPFGCRVDYWVGPKSQRKKRPRFEPTSEPGVFLGYYFQPGMKWKREILVLSLKDLNRNDFNECLTPIKANQFSVPEGEFVFPMKDRYERVRAGLAPDAIEGPGPPPLENQDAEPSDEQKAEIENASLKVEQSMVIDPVTGKYVPLPEGGRYYDSGGTLGRRYGGTRGTTKPDEIPTHLWVNMSKAQKRKAIEESAMKAALEKLDDDGGAGSSKDRPAGAVSKMKDSWEIRGKALIRYHFQPRRELFSPDLTDCPIEVSRLSNWRYTNILPVGGDAILDDEDDWRNFRRRNKKLRFQWIGQTVFEIKPLLQPTPNGDGSFPMMPVVPNEPEEHREKIAKPSSISSEEFAELAALVARPVGKNELKQNPKAQAALDVEWDKLMNKKAWDMESVREWSSVSDEAQRKSKKVHVGKIFEICVEKGSEPPQGDPLRKFKGRTVFQGNNVKDENNDTALFSELGSSPATMEAGKTLDAYGHMPGNVCEQADGKQAYTQTKLKGAETWVRLPRERWPKGWHGKFKDPVVRLALALYGHPDSGGFWEQHCEKMLKEVGFHLVFPAAWPSVFFHPDLKLLLAVYVDDFKMAGPKGNMAKGWELIASKIDMDTPSTLGRYLGCEHLSKTSSLGRADHPFAHVFDKSLPDPAAKPATAAPTQDYTEYFPEEGVVVRYHVQPRKTFYHLRPEEAKALNVGQSRLTEVTSLSFPEDVEEVWDQHGQSRKRGELWTGCTYLMSNEHNGITAMAAVKRVRDKTKAKKAARKQAFYDVNQLDEGKGCMTSPTRQVIYDMSSFLQQAIDRYKELAGPEFHNLKKVATPFYDDKIARPVEAEAEIKGKLSPIASRVLMKLLFAARMARFDLLRAVQGLAARVTKWSVDCDKALHRLMCYVQSTLHYKMSGFVGDNLDKCNLWLFADSDHAGEHDNRSTSGGYLVLVGPNTYFPLSAFSKKQTSAAPSSTEAEVVCANVSLRSLGLPSSALWSVLLNAGGGTTQRNASLTKGKAIDLSNLQDPEVSRVKTTGHHPLPDGRRLEVHTGVSIIPEPVDLTTHPLRDVWVQEKGKWTMLEEAVAWEELRNMSYSIKCDVLVCIYRRSAMDYRRFAKLRQICTKSLPE